MLVLLHGKHSKLIESDSTGSWITDFLSDRRQHTKLEEHVSWTISTDSPMFTNDTISGGAECCFLLSHGVSQCVRGLCKSTSPQYTHHLPHRSLSHRSGLWSEVSVDVGLWRFQTLTAADRSVPYTWHHRVICEGQTSSLTSPDLCQLQGFSIC